MTVSLLGVVKVNDSGLGIATQGRERRWAARVERCRVAAFSETRAARASRNDWGETT